MPELVNWFMQAITELMIKVGISIINEVVRRWMSRDH